MSDRFIGNPETIKESRMLAGLNIETVARETGIEQKKLEEAESKRGILVFDEARKLAALYDVPIACFYLANVEASSFDHAGLEIEIKEDLDRCIAKLVSRVAYWRDKARILFRRVKELESGET